MSEHRELARQLLDAIDYELKPWDREQFIESRLASFALEQRRKNFLEAARITDEITEKYQNDSCLQLAGAADSTMEVARTLRALAEQEPSNTREGGK